MMLKSNGQIPDENKWLRLRLEEAEAVVDAIRNGMVDAVVVSTPGENVYTLEGADRPYRLLVEAMQQPVAVLNSDGLLLYCNPCFASLFIVPLETLVGGTLDPFVAGSDLSIWTDILDAFRYLPVQKNIQLRRSDGTVFPASLAVSTLPLEKLCLLVTDLSQQKQFEELMASKVALRHSEIRYRRLFETAKDGILILDKVTGQITDANPFMCELLGYSHNQFLGKALWEIGLFSDKTANEAAVQLLQENGYLRYEHLPLESNTGRQVEVEVIANSYKEDEQNVIQCNIRDITERNRLEDERDRLETMMREQSAALEDLHRRKDEFLAMLSHELRNPLSPIASALQLLGLQKNEDRLQQQARKIIERQVGQLTRLINDLLEVSRITTGRIHLQQEQVALNDIMDNAVETVRSLLDQRKHVLTVTLPASPIWLMADAARLEQAIVNLLTNAAKFTDVGGQIWLAAWQEGDQCVLQVKDTGVGIAPGLLPHIFELFTQAERSLDRSQGGLGIGLALVHQIIEMHHGRVEVISTLGQGSEFTVHLPAIAELETQLTSTVDTIGKSIGPALRVLIVDDNEDSAQLLGMLLLQSGHDVRTAYDGPSSLEAFLDYRPNVVLLDIGLPGMDGFEVARNIRKQDTFTNVLLIAMTGYCQESDRRRSREAGFDHHMVKPIDFRKLQDILATVAANTT